MTQRDSTPSGAVTCDASTTPFALSVLTVTKGTASKQLLVGAGGLPVKDRGSLAITRGVLQHLQVDGLAGLKALLLAIRPDQALVHGIVKGSPPGHDAPVVTTDALRQAKPGIFEPGTIARSLEYLAYPAPYFLLMLDRDDHPDDPAKVATVDQLMRLLTPLLPGLATAGRLVTTSTSSGIKSKATDDWLTPPTGSHTYLLARGDIVRFKAIVKARLWNAGYGYCILASPHTQTGVASVLERTVVDVSVFSPERLDYVAGARIAKDAPFYQERGEPQLVGGTIFDLDALPELTPEEQQAYQERLAAAKAQLAPARVAAVQAAVEAADPDRPPGEVAAIVEQRLAQHEHHLLPPAYLLYFFHRTKAVQVQDLSEAGSVSKVEIDCDGCHTGPGVAIDLQEMNWKIRTGLQE